MRTLDFADGFTSNATPALGSVASSGLRVYANDAAYLAAKTDTPGVAAEGDAYQNSTLDQIRFCYDGVSFVTIPDELHDALLAGDWEFVKSVVMQDTIKAKEGLAKGLDANSAGVLAIGHTTATQVNIGATGIPTYIKGNLNVDGTTTVINSTTLDVVDPNITLNDGGNNASSEGAGLRIERTGTHGSLIYANAMASKFAVGDLGSEAQVVTVSHAQTLTNKTIDADSNTITNIENADIKAGADIARSKIDNGTNGYVVYNDNTNGYLNEEQYLNKVRGGTGADNSGVTFPTSGVIVTETGIHTLTNKTIDADLNTISNIDNNEIKAAAGIARSKLGAGTAEYVVYNASGTGLFAEEQYLSKVRGGTGIDNSAVTFPATGVIVTEAGTHTLTNKTIDADLNTLSNIDNADIKAAANIARTKLASGTANHVIINDGSGVLSSEASLLETRGGTHQTTYTTGDILYASASNTLSKLPIGTNGEVLTVVGGIPEWDASSGGSFSEYERIVANPSITGSTDTTIASAITNGTAGKQIKITNGTYTENPSFTKQTRVTGYGRSSIIDGNVTFASGSSYSQLENVKITGTVTIASGVVGVWINDVYVTSSFTYTDSNTTDNNNFFQGMQE